MERMRSHSLETLVDPLHRTGKVSKNRRDVAAGHFGGRLRVERFVHGRSRIVEVDQESLDLLQAVDARSRMPSEADHQPVASDPTGTRDSSSHLLIPIHCHPTSRNPRMWDGSFTLPVREKIRTLSVDAPGSPDMVERWCG